MYIQKLILIHICLISFVKTPKKDIEDQHQSDDQLKRKFDEISAKHENGVLRLKELKSGHDNFNLLHYAVKARKNKMVQFLIDELKFGKFEFFMPSFH